MTTDTIKVRLEGLWIDARTLARRLGYRECALVDGQNLYKMVHGYAGPKSRSIAPSVAATRFPIFVIRPSFEIRNVSIQYS